MKQQVLFYSFLFLASFVTSCTNDSTACEEWIINCEDTGIQVDTSKSNRKVLIIGIDGVRSEAMTEDISPFLYEFSNRPTTYFTDRNLVERLTFSGPNWSSLLTGVHFCKHKVFDNKYSNNELSVFPHFFNYIERANSSIVTASIVNWIPINQYSAIAHADHAPTNQITDQEVFEQAQELLQNQTPIDPDVLFLHFDELDGAGHEFGYHPDVTEYANTLNTIDGYIQQIVATIETKRSNGEDWIIFVVSDHGGDGKGHGGGFDNEHIKYTIFYANHPTESFIQNHTSTQVDLVPSVLYFMGIISDEFNCKKDGISIML